MKLLNGQIYKAGKFITGSIEFDDTIKAVKPQDTDEVLSEQDYIDVTGLYVIPGLVDIHTHGCKLADASDGISKGMGEMSKYYASNGVTSWCPTTMTLSENDILSAVGTVRDFTRPVDGAKAIGVNLEGPFLSFAKKGAQNPDNLHIPDIEMLKRIIKESGDMVKLVTVAPEEPNAIEFIKEAAKLTTVSIGHTAASYEEALEAFENGADHVTHLYNAMPSIHHRNPGVIPAAADCDAFVEIIVDGLHVHPSVVRMTHKLFKEKMVLISDSIRCTGMPDGNYTLGGLDVELINGKVTLLGTDTIAGSTLNLIDAVRNCVKMGISLEDSIYAATAAPSISVGQYDKIGSLDAGKAADIVILDKDLNIKAVFVEGKSCI